MLNQLLNNLGRDRTSSMTPSQIRLTQTLKKTLLLLDMMGLFAIPLLIFNLRTQMAYEVALAQPLLLAFIGLNILTLYIFGAYDIATEARLLENFVRVLFAGLAGFGIFIGFVYLSRTEVAGLFGRGVLLPSGGLFILYAFGLRILLRLRIRYLRESRWTWLAFGDRESLDRLKQDMAKKPITGQIETLVVEKTDDFYAVMDRLRDSWEGLILATKIPLPEEISKAFLNYRLKHGLQILSLTQFYHHFWGKLPVHYLENQWLLTTEGFSLTHNPIGLRIKRLIDIGLSILLLILTWPLLLVTMVAIKVDSRGPVFFRQNRTGKEGLVFSILKFRSMTVDAEKHGAQWAQKNDQRITRVGKWIRATRIDELPQILNVLLGEMSFIGPRPERPEFNESLETQIPYYNLRHLLRPGITGWAQVMYPYGASVEDAREKLQYDLFYIKNYTVGLDVLIILKTVSIVLFGKGR